MLPVLPTLIQGRLCRSNSSVQPAHMRYLTQQLDQNPALPFAQMLHANGIGGQQQLQGDGDQRFAGRCQVQKLSAASFACQ